MLLIAKHTKVPSITHSTNSGQLQYSALFMFLNEIIASYSHYVSFKMYRKPHRCLGCEYVTCSSLYSRLCATTWPSSFNRMHVCDIFCSMRFHRQDSITLEMRAGEWEAAQIETKRAIYWPWARSGRVYRHVQTSLDDAKENHASVFCYILCNLKFCPSSKAFHAGLRRKRAPKAYPFNP